MNLLDKYIATLLISTLKNWRSFIQKHQHFI